MTARPKAKKKSRNNNSLAKLLALNCRWQGCSCTFELPLEEYQTFAEHVMQHIGEFFNALSCGQNIQDLSQLLSYKCLWNDCIWEVRGNEEEYTRHVMFHAYHSRLKCLGAFLQILENADPCKLDVETQDLLPDVTEPFLCKWDSCGINVLCPDKFYRHVGMHGHSASKEDVMVITEKSGKLYSLPNSNEVVNGMPVQKMMQCVCRWEGCSFLAQSAVKIKEHCRTHTGERQFACPNCGGFFSNKTKFIDHLTRQNTKLYENFQCSHCLRRCASERLLRDHMRHHVNHVKCPHCDMTCANPSSLRSHIKFRHSMERPFKCAMCSFSCKTANDLKRHEETHFERRFPCEVENCDFLAKTMAGLRSHAKLVHEKRVKDQFMCHICQRQFSRGYFLTTHLKTEHDFSWPAGHTRFQYKRHEDGYYRLQMVRFESAELSEILTEDNGEGQGIGDDWITESSMAEATPGVTESNVDVPSEVVVTTALEAGVSCSDYNAVYSSQECSATLASEASTVSKPLEVSLCHGYVEMLHYYEAQENAKECNLESQSVDLQCKEGIDESLIAGVNKELTQNHTKNVGMASHLTDNSGTETAFDVSRISAEGMLDNMPKSAHELRRKSSKSTRHFTHVARKDPDGIVGVKEDGGEKIGKSASDGHLGKKYGEECTSWSWDDPNIGIESSAESGKEIEEEKGEGIVTEMTDKGRKRAIKAERTREAAYDIYNGRRDGLSVFGDRVGSSFGDHEDAGIASEENTEQIRNQRLGNHFSPGNQNTRSKRKREATEVRRTEPRIRKSKGVKREKLTDESEKAGDYEQVILDVSRTLLSLHDSDNNDGNLLGIKI